MPRKKTMLSIRSDCWPPSTLPTSSPIKKPSSKSSATPSASSWSSQMAVTSRYLSADAGAHQEEKGEVPEGQLELHLAGRSRSAARTAGPAPEQHHPQGYQARQYLLRGRGGQAGRPECVQGARGLIRHHPDRHSLLYQSRDLE